jgi:hypothetical protein
MDDKRFKRLVWWASMALCAGFWIAVIWLMVFNWPA